MESIIKVEGMSCQHCVKAVEGALVALQGVREAKVSLKDKHVEVSFDERLVGLKEMKAAIEDQGYDVP